MAPLPERPKMIVIGYGNPLRGDDGAGRLLADALKRSVGENRIEVRSVHQLTPELAEEISRAGLAVFLDASASGVPGTWTCRAVGEPAGPPSGAFTHHCTPETLLSYSQRLYGAHPRAVLCTVAGAAFGIGEEMSEAVLAALPRLLSELERIVEKEEASHA